MYDSIILLITGSVIGIGAWYYFAKDKLVNKPSLEKDEEDILAEQDLIRLEESLKTLEKKLKTKTPKQIEKYWNDNN